MFEHYAGYVISAAALTAALIYIGRQIGRVTVILQRLARLPGEHAQLLQATRANTEAIARLTAQQAALTADVARLAHQ